MKASQLHQVEYGPETPGYAQLNEQLRRDRAGVKPKPSPKVRRPKSQANDQTTK